MTESLAGRVLSGRFRIESELGRGAMGVVYSGMQMSLARAVAIKVLRRELSTDANMVARFRAEAEQAARLAHPNIVEILEFGHEPDGLLWIAMEKLEGESLATRLTRLRTLSEAETIRIALDVLSGLGAAHERRVVHRDLKPDNVFLAGFAGGKERAKLVDFGIAKLQDADALGKLTATGAVVGTPYYMSPEQARGYQVDGRTDLYALGAIMFEMLGGRPPIMAETFTSLLLAILTEEPPALGSLRPDLTPELVRVVMRSLAKNRDERFANANEMALALEALGKQPPRSYAPPVFAATAHASSLSVATPIPASQQVPAPMQPRFPHPPVVTERKSTSWPVIAVTALVTLALAAIAFFLYAVSGDRRSQEAIASPAPTSAPMPALAQPAPLPEPAPTPEEEVVPAPAVTPTPATPLPATASTPTRSSTNEDDLLTNSRRVRDPRAARERPEDRHPGAHSGASAHADSEADDAPVAASRNAPYIRFGGGEFPDLTMENVHSAIDHIPWQRCWPAGHTARSSVTSRSFMVRVGPNGGVTNVEYDDEPAEFMRCVASRIRAVNFGETTTQRSTTIRLTLAVEPRD